VTAPDSVKLVLFDIDGTILWTDGAGRRAVHAALTEVFGSVGPEGTMFDGKTDRQIVRELMRLDGHADDHIEAPDASPPRLLPGVKPLLDALEARDDVVLGLLTGNVEPGARAKLAAVGIDFARFRVNAFGSDHELRPELPEIARARGEAALGRPLAGADVVVIGDTPADVQCGRGIGARAIGVATGRYTTAQLAEHGAAAVFQDLTDTAAVVRAVMG
jgi:phosphoglycolate phosphatase